MKVVLVGAPLYKDQRAKFWGLVRNGYMPMGIQSYRSFPHINQWEWDTDTRISATDYEMIQIMKTFTGWLYCASDPDRYVGR